MYLNSVPATTRQRLPLCLALAVITAISGCDSDRTNRGVSSGQSAQPVLQGNVHAGPVKGATVVAFSVDGNGKLGPTIGQGSTTDDEGFFKLSRNPDEFSRDYTGPIVLTATGGEFLSEGDGQTKILGTTLRGVAILGVFDPDVELPKVNVTILTTLATRLAERGTAGLTEQSIRDATDLVESVFGDTFDLNLTELLDPNEASATADTPAQLDHTAVVAAFAQLAADLNKSVDETFDLVVRDIEDGALDGRDANDSMVFDDSGVSTLLIRALNNFINNTTNKRNIVVSSTLQNAINNFSGRVVSDQISGIDQKSPSVAERFPLPGDVDIALNSRVFIRFSEDVDSSSINSNNISVSGGSGAVAGAFQYTSSSRTAVFIPSVGFAANDTVTVNVSTQVRDLAGNALSQNDSFAFRTGTTIVSNTGFAGSLTLTPSSASTVSRNVVAVARFDRALDATSVFTPGVFRLTQNGTDVPFRLNYIVGSKAVSVTPLLPLDGNTNYRFTIAGSLFDTNGVSLGTDRSTTFLVGNAGSPDLTLPTIVSTFPEAGALTVGLTDSIKIRFDEAMNLASVLGAAGLSQDSNGQSVGLDTQFDSATNTLSLTPTTALVAGESYTLTISTSASDLAGNKLATAFTAQFTTAGPALRALTTNLVAGVTGQPYFAQIRVVGGMPPYNFAVSNGSTLPTGIVLNANGNGVLSGSVAQAGSNQFSVDISDSSNPPQRISQNLTLTVNDVVTQATIAFSSSTIVTLNESNQNVSVAVQLLSPGPLANQVTVNVEELGSGSATSNVDYTSLPGPVVLTFPAQSASGTTLTFDLPILDDNIFEGSETIDLALTNLQGSGAVIGGGNRLSITITDDELLPTLDLDPTTAQSVDEGQAGLFRLTLSNPSVQDVSFDITLSGSAANAMDQDLTAGTVTITAGSTEALINFNAIADGIDEDDVETLTLEVSNVSNATIPSGSVALVESKSIRDLDAFSVVSVTGPVTVSEAAGTATYTVSLDRAHQRTGSSVQVSISTASGTADSSDFTTNADFLTFMAGETTKSFDVALLDDSTNEPDETFSVSLSGETLLTVGTGSFQTTISDDDQASLVGFVNPSMDEDENRVGSVIVELELSAASGFDVSIDYAVDSSSTASNPDDHNLVAGTVNFIAGATSGSFSFDLVDDNLSEGPETISISLSNPVNAGLGTQSTSVITIVDDENAPTASLSLLSSAGALTPTGNIVSVNEDVGAITARVSLSNASINDTQVDVAVGSASNAQQPVDNTDLNSSDPLAAVYVARNGSVNGATLAVITPFASSASFQAEFQIPSLDLLNNEGAVVTTRGELVQAGDVMFNGAIAPSVRVVANISDRAAGVGFDPALGDKIFVGSATTLVQPKGLDVDSGRARILVADFGGRKIVVFGLNGNAGNVAPVGSIDLSAVTGISGRPWDLDFDSASNRLFVAMTDGHVLVFDDVFGSQDQVLASTPNRAFAVAFDSGSGPQKDSDNLHGIDFDPTTNNLYLSDVGAATTSSAAGFNTDGRIYRVLNADAAGSAPAASQALVLADLRIESGNGIRLGNPVDIVFDGQNLYVAEKTDDLGDNGGVLIFSNINSANNSGALPPLSKVAFGAGEGVESIALDSGRRQDHTLRRMSVVIPAGQTEADLSFNITNDDRQEVTDSLEVILDSPVGVTLGLASLIVEIQDDDAAPVFSSTTTVVTEGEEVVLVLTLDRVSGQSSSFTVDTADMSASSPADFAAISGQSLTFVEGQRYQTLRISTVDDTLNESGAEQFTVNYSAASNLTIGTSSVTIDINDNDNLPSLTLVGATSVDEAVGTVSYTAILSAASGLDVTADLALTGATTDANLAANSITIPAGQTFINFDVSVVDDDINEVAQFFTVTMSNVSASAVFGTTTDVTTRIVDNDSVSASFALTNSVGTETGTDIVGEVTLDRLSEQDIEFTVTSAGAGLVPSNASDFSSPTSVIVTAGTMSSELRITVNDDMVNEAVETLQIDLTLTRSIVGYANASQFSEMASIEDDDLVNVVVTFDSAGSEDGTAVAFTATLSIPSEQELNFSSRLMNLQAGIGIATASDLGTFPSIVFPALGGVQQSFEIPVIDDSVNELDESFDIEITATPAVNNFDLVGSTLTANGTINDNDELFVTLTEVQGGSEAGQLSLDYLATINTESSQTLNFTITTNGVGTSAASFLTDYDFPVVAGSVGDQLTITPGTTSSSFSLPVNQDNVNEASETLETTITRNSAYRGFNDASSNFAVQSSILDDDPVVLRITAQGNTGTLSEAGGPNQVFSVEIDRATEQAFSVSLSVQGTGVAPATVGADFNLIDTSVAFAGAPGSLAVGPANATVQVIDDTVNEAVQQYQVVLGSVVGGDASISVSTDPMMNRATATILDDDTLTLALTLGSAGAEANAGTVTDISVDYVLSTVSEQTAEFAVSVIGSGADPLEASDFVAPASSLMIAAGTTSGSIVVGVVEDGVNEATESLTVSLMLSNIVNGFDAVNSDLSEDVSVTDDDIATVSLVASNNGLVAEDAASISISVELDIPSEQVPELTVTTVQLANGRTASSAAAIEGTDYVALSQTVVLSTQAVTVVIDVTDDLDAEMTEDFDLQGALTVIPSGVIAGNLLANLSITDNDNAEVVLSSNGAVTEGSASEYTVTLSGPKSSSIDLTASLARSSANTPAGSRVISDPISPSDYDNAEMLNGLYVVRNDGSASLERVTLPLVDQTQISSTFEGNQGSAVDSRGRLFLASDFGGGASIRVIDSVASRANNDSFNAQTDSVITGAATLLQLPKGLDVDSQQKLLFVADFGAQKILVFSTQAVGNVAPVGQIDLNAAPWDMDYVPSQDRLFVAMTNGECLVFDDFVANYVTSATPTSSGTPSKTLIPSSAGTKASVNLHGIDYNASLDELYLSDVGSASVADDGALFVLRQVTAASSGNAEFAIKIAGPATTLGNPVDIVANGSILYVAEKANNLVLAYDLSGLPAGVPNQTLDRAPDASVTRTRPESVALDNGSRADVDVIVDQFSMTLTFAPGETTKTFSIATIDDSVFEGATAEVVIAKIATSSAVATITTDEAFGLINDNEADTQISFENLSVAEGDSGTTSARLVARLSQLSEIDSNFDFSTRDGVTAPTATVADGDYNMATGTITVPGGQSFASVDVEINGDTNDEADETFFVDYANLVNLVAAGAVSAEVTITNDDNVVTVSIADAVMVNEGDPVLRFVVSLSAVSGKTVEVEVSTTGGDATVVDDFTGITSQVLSFAPGQTTIDVDVALVDDNVNEADETIIVTLANPVASILGTATATGTVQDNDDITVSIADATGNETDALGSNVDFVVSLSGPSQQDIFLEISTQDGTAQGGADFTVATNRSLVILGNTGNATASIALAGEVVAEEDENFTVAINLSSTMGTNRGVSIATGNATGTIVDDDNLTVELGVDPAAVSESVAGGQVTFSVLASGKPGTSLGRDFVATVSTVDGTATSGNDFAGLNNQSVSFSAATPNVLTQSIAVNVVSDLVNEADQSFSLTLTGLSNSPVRIALGARTSASATIIDDDALVIDLLAGSTTSLPEDVGLSVMTFVRQTNTEQTITFDATTQVAAPVSAGATGVDTDFVAETTPLTISAAQATASVSVTINDDLLDEDNETFEILLSNLVGNNVSFANTLFTITIEDNDLEPTLDIDLASSTLNVAEEGGDVSLVVSLNVESGRDVTFTLESADGTGVMGAKSSLRPDFVAVSQSITIPARTLLTTQIVTINGDSINEATESFTLSISSPTNAVIGVSSATATITDNDAVTLDIDNPVLTEGDVGTSLMTFTLSLSTDTEQLITVDYQTADRNALNVGPGQGDYEATSGTSTFDGQANFGQRQVTVDVVVNNDDINETILEEFELRLSNPVIATFGASNGVGLAKIEDEDPLTISIADLMITESDVDQDAMFNVVFDRLSEQVIILSVVTDNTGLMTDPVDAADISNVPTTVTAPGLQASIPFTISIAGDNVNEDNEQINVRIAIIGTPDQVNIGQDVSVLTINDDDDLTVDIVSSVTVFENAGPATFAVQITDKANPSALGATEQVINVTLDTAASTLAAMPPNNVAATPVDDFIAVAGSMLTFDSVMPASQNQDVDIVNEANDINEPDEIFDLVVTAMMLPRGVEIGIASQTATIVDDDTVTIVLTAPMATTELDTGASAMATFTITYNGLSSQTVDLELATEVPALPAPTDPAFSSTQAIRDRVTATPGADYTEILESAPETRTFGPEIVNPLRTMTVDVEVLGDDINEAIQEYLLRVTNSDMLPRGILVQPSLAFASIDDNDDVNFLISGPMTAIAEDMGPVTFNITAMPTNPATMTTEQTFSIDFEALNGDGDALTPAFLPTAVAAEAPIDFDITSNTLTISGTATVAVALPVAAPLTQDVVLVNDTINEPSEDFNGQISNVSPATTRGVAIAAGMDTATVVIVDDDTLVLGFRSVGDVLEGAAAQFQIFVDDSAMSGNEATGTTQTITYMAETMDLAPAQAVAGTDYTAISPAVTNTINGAQALIVFGPQQVLDTFNVVTNNDLINEADEDFQATASNVTGELVQLTGMGPPTFITVNQTITDDDTLTFEVAADADYTEADMPAVTRSDAFTINVSGSGTNQTNQSFRIPLNFAGVGAIPAADVHDFSLASLDSANFTAGAVEYDVGASELVILGTAMTPVAIPSAIVLTLEYVNDDDNEALVESFSLTLGAPTGMTAGVMIGAQNTATQNINDDDRLDLEIVSNPLTRAEELPGAAIDFEVNRAATSLSVATEQTFTLAFTTTDGDGGASTAATSGTNDYTFVNQAIDFTGTTGMPVAVTVGLFAVSVSVNDDTVNEDNEAFSGSISLASAITNVQLNTTSAVATILDNDPIDLVISTTANAGTPLLENSGMPVPFLVENTGNATTDTEQNWTVDFTTGDVIAVAGDDYTMTAGPLTFGPGMISVTQNVVLNDDVFNEAVETFTGTISSIVPMATARGVVIMTPVATASIDDEDDLVLNLSVATASQNEGATYQFNINPVGAINQTEQVFTVQFDTQDPAGSTALLTAESAANMPNANFTTADYTPANARMVAIRTRLAGTVTQATNTDMQVVSTADIFHEPDEVFEGAISNAVEVGGQPTLRGVSLQMNGTVVGATILNDDSIIANFMTTTFMPNETDADADTMVPVVLTVGGAASISEFPLRYEMTASLPTAVPGMVDPAEFNTPAGPVDDFSLSGLLIAPGNNSGNFMVTITGDDINEFDETFSVSFAAIPEAVSPPAPMTIPVPADSSVGGVNSANFTIQDDDIVTLLYTATISGASLFEQPTAGTTMQTLTYTLDGAASTEQEFVVQITGSGVPAFPATPPGSPVRDFLFVVGGIDQAVDVLSINYNVGQTFPLTQSYSIRIPQVVSGDEELANPETARLTTAGNLGGLAPVNTPINNYVVTVGQVTQDFTITDQPVLNVNGAGNLAAPSRALTYNTGSGLTQISDGPALLSSTQSYNGVVLDVNLFGETVAGDTLNVDPTMADLTGGMVTVGGTAIAMVNTSTRVSNVAAPGLGDVFNGIGQTAQLMVTFNAAATNANIATFVSAFRYQDGGKSGLRDLLCSFRISNLPLSTNTENRDVEINVMGTPAFINLDRTTAPENPVNLSSTPGAADRYVGNATSILAPNGVADPVTDNDGNNYAGLTMTATIMGNTVAFGDATILAGNGTTVVVDATGNIMAETALGSGLVNVGSVSNFGFATPIADDGPASFVVTFNANANEYAVDLILNDISFQHSLFEGDGITPRDATDDLVVQLVVTGVPGTVTETINVTLN